MMISPSENGAGKSAGRGSVAGIPMRLLGGGVRTVSRLEFLPLGQPEIEAAEVATEKPEVLLKEEVAALDARLRSQADEISAQMEMARREAREEARLEWQRELEDGIIRERQAVLKACEQFVQERTRYFAGVEAEVVKLALAIATRVLHREAKLDPLLLSGV